MEMDYMTLVIVLMILLIALKILRIVSKVFFKAASIVLTLMFIARLWLLLEL